MLAGPSPFPKTAGLGHIGTTGDSRLKNGEATFTIDGPPQSPSDAFGLINSLPFRITRV
jgi:hypothetical protein